MVVGDLGHAVRAALDADQALHLVEGPDEELLAGAGEIARIAAALRAFEALLGSGSVSRVVVVGDSDPALAAVLVASKVRIPAAAVEGDAPNPGDGSSALNRRLIEQLADAAFADDAKAIRAWLAAPQQPSGPGASTNLSPR